MPVAVLDGVRSACAEVAARSRAVQIDQAQLSAYAATLPISSLQSPTLDAEHHFVGSPPETIAFVVTLDAINFGSGYFPHLQKRPGLSGYFTVATSLKSAFESRGPFSADELSRLTAADCATLFGQRLDDPVVAELMGLFAVALGDLGRYLHHRFRGSFVALIETAQQSAERLVQLLAEMPFFADVEEYPGLRVPFYKRAQLTAADLSLALHGAGLGRFVDLDRLTIFADNLVPHVLRLDGVLRYDPALLAHIEAGELIPAGSPEEVEIRACAVHAVELLVAELQRIDQPTTAHQLDYYLWNRGQQPQFKARPRHRTRTVFY